jgi:signal transduction histidine kinase
LGLSIVKTILDKHQMKYGVISEYGKGSDFYFVMPGKVVE